MNASFRYTQNTPIVSNTSTDLEVRGVQLAVLPPHHRPQRLSVTHPVNLSVISRSALIDILSAPP